MTTVACVLIVGRRDDRERQHRQQLVRDAILPSIIGQGFDEIAVVGDYEPGALYHYYPVPPITGTTLDALIKRDVGTVATTSDVLLYLCDDHALMTNGEPVADVIREFSGSAVPWDVAIPKRYAEHPEQGMLRINNGESQGYCGGHAGIFRRRVIREQPWTAQVHSPIWDALSSRRHQSQGFRYVANAPVSILDLEPERSPWQ